LPDLLLPDFYLFRIVKSQLKGWHFSSADEVKYAMTAALKSILEYDSSGVSKDCTADGKSV
jgi:hypothetical protein